MNKARLKLRSAQRRALIEKTASKCEKCDAEVSCKECDKCDEHCGCKTAAVKTASFKCSKCGEVVNDKKAADVHVQSKHKGEGDVIFTDYKAAYWQGTTEPTPGKPQYKPDGGGEPKIRMNDKQMHQDKSMGGADKSFPGDEAEKKKHLRAELEQRALHRRAYWLGTEEPTPGKPKYKKDPLNEKLRNNEDRQMKQTKSMGGDDGSFPGDEAEKKKHLRAELAEGRLRTKFTALRNADGSFNKSASYFEVFAGENKLLRATAEEIYGDELERAVEGADGKTGWDLLTSPEYGKEVMAAIRIQGFDKVAYMLKGAQAVMPELPAQMPGMDAAPVSAPVSTPEAPKEDEKKVEVNANELMSLVGDMEEKLDRMRTEVTGESEDAVKDVAIEGQDVGAEEVGAELTASIRMLGKEVYAELDRSADELALLVDYFQKSAKLSVDKQAELQKIAADAVSDGKALMEEADTILAVAGKVPPGLKAFQDKQKGKKKDKDEDKDKAKDKGKDKKKDDKKEKGKDKDKKKSKKSELAEALMKLASELESEGEGAIPETVVEEPIVATAEDELDKEMKALGLDGKADDDDMCGECGMAMDDGHKHANVTQDDEMISVLAARRNRREALLKAAEEKKYDVQPDSHGMLDEAHKGGGSTTQLDNKPAGDGAKVEDLDEVKKKMLEVAEGHSTGKQGAAQEVNTKEAAVKAAMETEMKAKKAETDKSIYRVKVRRAYDCALMMQEKGMIPRTKTALDAQVDEVMKFDDAAFESFKRVIANTQGTVKTASKVPQVGVREDNSQPGDNVVETSFADQLKKIW